MRSLEFMTWEYGCSSCIDQRVANLFAMLVGLSDKDPNEKKVSQQRLESREICRFGESIGCFAHANSWHMLSIHEAQLKCSPIWIAAVRLHTHQHTMPRPCPMNGSDAPRLKLAVLVFDRSLGNPKDDSRLLPIEKHCLQEK